jgi:DNA helicase-2/ATP-dependent DNA helicase PcrA
MTDIDFTEAQRELIEATTSTYVEACPGAGKTQAIVQRFIGRPLAHPRKGVGLISFTNAAIDEARERCVDAPGLREVPNFTGTIDSFINRFIVGPTFLARRGVAPRFHETWAAVPHSNVRVKGVALSASLDWFAVRGNEARLNVDRIPVERRASAARLAPHEVAQIEEAAMAIWNRFVARGTLSASAARVALRTYLGEPERRQQLGALLANRFAEVIVDEVQDCSSDDLLVLELLYDFGVTIVAVGDPDQSIYGFRSDAPADVTKFLAKLSEGQRLDGNFRSSPAICSVVDSLRSGTVSDIPVGPNRDVESPVVLMSYGQRRTVSRTLRGILETHGIARDEVVVLAHAADHARVAAGAPGAGPDTANKLVILARAHHVLSDVGRAAKERVEAIRSVERIIREQGLAEVTDLDQPEYLEACHISERNYREACLRIAAAVPRPFDMKPSEFRAAIAAMSDSQRRLRWTTKGLKSPNGDEWPSTPTAHPSGGSLPHSTIHGLKGRQAPAIALVIPEARAGADGTRQWCEGQAGEERRVLYVGASRAERILIIAAHDSIFDNIHARLRSDGVSVLAHVGS